ncbi:hypothetical protein [Salmonirosea aquatica]|uniref:Lipoprotein n=1 Tax=Salmonirosea aquatica TaxID=2654236 RepID=A0A7C9BG63_9BACT|nr:hypothetical protein [Cytophagaceae bacterium SJW1-29]
MNKPPLSLLIFFILLFGTFLLQSCGEDQAYTFEKFNEQALDFAKDDQLIDQQEYETLTQGIQSSDDRSFRTLKNENGEVDHGKVAAYLKKYFDAKGIPVIDIWKPGTASGTSANFNVSVYLENSVSMDGYVDANSTAFKATLLDLLTNLENFAATDTLNLNYINSTIIPVKAAATKDDITEFYQNLNRTNFKSQGGTRGTSDIGDVLSKILNQQKPHELSVLVSDFVFSPGGQNAVKYLEGQRSQIRSEFVAARGKNPNLSVAILQGQAQFEGTYYDQNDKPHAKLDAARPYYLWLIGTAAQIQQVLDARILEQTRNGFSNKLVIQSASEALQPPFKIMYRPRIGEFDSKSLAQGIITDAQAARDDRNKGIFEFNVAVNFSKGMQDAGYFLDSTNYKLSNEKYSLRAKTINDRNDPSLSGFTHLLTLRTTDLKDEKLRIDVVGKVPGWVYTTSSEDDTQIETNADEARKTFGFSYLVEGVSDAFYPRSQANPLYTIPLTIQK